MPEAVPGQFVPYCTVALFMKMGARRRDRARAQINVRRRGGSHALACLPTCKRDPSGV